MTSTEPIQIASSIDVNRLAEAFEQDHPDSAATFKELNHRQGGPYHFFANLNGVRKEAQAIRLCSQDLFGAVWKEFYAFVPGKMVNRSQNWARNQHERFLRGSSPYFPAANSGFPTDASPGTQDVTLYILDSIRFQYNTRRKYNGLNPNVIEEVIERYTVSLSLCSFCRLASLAEGVLIRLAQLLSISSKPTLKKAATLAMSLSNVTGSSASCP